MSVEFEGDFKASQYGNRNMTPGSSQVGGMAGWLIRKGIIQQESQAKALLLLIVAINFIVMIAVIIKYVL